MSRFAKYSWGVLGLNLIVILWGAFVRASNSGNGCGSHWPLCNGEVLPPAPTVKTLIEFSHRISSGLALISVVVLLVWAFRLLPKLHPARTFASLSMAFMASEALLGAGLVLFEYVAENKSIGRAVWMSAHLINTFLLVAMITLTAWSADRARVRLSIRGSGNFGGVVMLSLAGTLLLGVSGAVAALGATLFPVRSLAEGLRADLSSTAHLLIRLRFFHPFIAVGVGAMLVTLAWFSRSRGSRETRRSADVLIAFVFVQLVAGLVNVLLHAPVWLQILHLLLSDGIWIALVLTSASVLSRDVRAAHSLQKDEALAEFPPL